MLDLKAILSKILGALKDEQTTLDDVQTTLGDVQTVLDSIFNRMVYVTHTTSAAVASGADNFRNHYTAPSNGYLVGFVHASYPSNSTGRRATRGYITTNGSRAYNAIEDMRMAVSGTATGVTLPVVVRLTAGQIFGVRVYQNSGSSLTIVTDLVGLFIKDL